MEKARIIQMPNLKYNVQFQETVRFLIIPLKHWYSARPLYSPTSDPIEFDTIPEAEDFVMQKRQEAKYPIVIKEL